MRNAIFVLVLALCACSTAKTSKSLSSLSGEGATNSLLMLCEHAITDAASRFPDRRSDFQTTFNELAKIVADNKVTRPALASALSHLKIESMIPPEGGIVTITSDDVFANNQPVPDAMLYDVAAVLWAGLNKVFNP